MSINEHTRLALQDAGAGAIVLPSLFEERSAYIAALSAHLDATKTGAATQSLHCDQWGHLSQ